MVGWQRSDEFGERPHRSARIKPHHAAGCAPDDAPEEKVFPIDEKVIAPILVAEYVRLGGDVGGHRRVAVQVIRKDVGDEGNVRGKTARL
jgi:hypothetical protein